MNIVGALIVRVTHTGLKPDGSPNLSSVTLYDLDEPTIQKYRPRAVPVPVGATVDIPMSTRTFISWATGAIFKFVRDGYLTSEVILQLRDRQNFGGPAGTGQTLRPVVTNAERVGNVLRLVLPDNVIPTTLDSIGYLVGEGIEITGLTGAFLGLDGTYEIITATPGDGIAGAQAGSYLIEVNSVGPDIPSATHPAGVNIALTQGRIAVELTSNGNLGGLGANVYGYVGGQTIPHTTGGGGPPAPHAPTHIFGGTDVVDGDRLDITYVPTNYTRDTTPPEVTVVTELTAHLAGIDNALGALETFTAGENLTAGDLLTLDAAGQVIRANSSIAGAIWEVVGVSNATVLSGASVTVYTRSGTLTNIRFGAAPAGALNGQLVFLDTASGLASITPPTAPGNSVFTVGTLQGANGITTTPAVVFRPQFIAQRR